MIDHPFEHPNNPHSNFPTHQQYLDSLIDPSLSDTILSDLSQLKLIKIKNYITKLLSHIRTLEEEIVRNNSQFQQLESELEAKVSAIQLLTVSKTQIQQSVQRILNYNTQYLQIIEEKEAYILELEQERQETEGNCSMLNTGCFINKGRIGEIQGGKEGLGVSGGNGYKARRSELFLGSEKNIEKLRKSKRGGNLLLKVKEYVSETQMKYRREEGQKNMRTSREKTVR